MDAAERMRDEGQRQVRDAAVLRLQARQRLELEGAHRGGGNAALLQHDCAVDTPRRAGPSIRAADQSEVALRERGERLRRWGPGHRLVALDDLADAVPF